MLNELAGVDFGYHANADREDRARALKRMAAWWADRNTDPQRLEAAPPFLPPLPGDSGGARSKLARAPVDHTIGKPGDASGPSGGQASTGMLPKTQELVRTRASPWTHQMVSLAAGLALGAAGAWALRRRRRGT